MPSYNHKLACILEYYMARGYSLEQCLDYCLRDKESIDRVYDIIQKEQNNHSPPSAYK